MCVFILRSSSLTLIRSLSCALEDFNLFGLRSWASPALSDDRTMMGPLELLVFAALFRCVSASTEVCTNSLLPGAKGNARPTLQKSESLLMC